MIYSVLRWIRPVGPTCTLLLTHPPYPFTSTHNTSTIFLILIEKDVTSLAFQFLSYNLQVLIIPRSFYENRSAFREMKKEN